MKSCTQFKLPVESNFIDSVYDSYIMKAILYAIKTMCIDNTYNDMYYR